jgi:hypothetical protein
MEPIFLKIIFLTAVNILLGFILKLTSKVLKVKSLINIGIAKFFFVCLLVILQKMILFHLILASKIADLLFISAKSENGKEIITISLSTNLSMRFLQLVKANV